MPQRTDKKTLGRKIVSLSALGPARWRQAREQPRPRLCRELPAQRSGPARVSRTSARRARAQLFVNSIGSFSSGGAAARASAMNGAKLAYQNPGALRLFPGGVKWTTAGPLGAGGSFLIGGRFWSRTFPEAEVGVGGIAGIGRIGRIGRIGKAGRGRKGKGRAGLLGAGVGRQSPSSYTSSPCCSSSPTASTGNTHHGVNGNTPFSNEYALFTFQNGSTTLYGWVDLSYSVTDSFGPNGTPNLTIISWAYANSGAVLPAGDTTLPTPEPATGIATGLAALALGAEGLRRWRKARKAA